MDHRVTVYSQFGRNCFPAAAASVGDAIGDNAVFASGGQYHNERQYASSVSNGSMGSFAASKRSGSMSQRFIQRT